MAFWELLLIGVGLSMDAFAVSVCKGLGMSKINLRNTLTIGLFFGGFQALMPLIGWMLGVQFEQYITSFDHWVAFGLLVFIGGKMVWDVLRGGEEQEIGCDDSLNLRELLVLAIATSIDALAVGISFAFLEVNIGEAIATIGAVTLLISIAGVFIGHQFGARYQAQATLAGGIILILIGSKILLEHLGILG